MVSISRVALWSPSLSGRLAGWVCAYYAFVSVWKDIKDNLSSLHPPSLSVSLISLCHPIPLFSLLLLLHIFRFMLLPSLFSLTHTNSLTHTQLSFSHGWDFFSRPPISFGGIVYAPKYNLYFIVCFRSFFHQGPFHCWAKLLLHHIAFHFNDNKQTFLFSHNPARV